MRVKFILVCFTFGVPAFAVADHMPDNLSQELDPNYVACMMAVDDSASEFRFTLQVTCAQTMVDTCSGQNGVALPSQVVDCIHYETQRAIEFVRASVADLPDVAEQAGFIGHGYKRRRDNILRDVDTLRSLPKPQSTEAAIQQVVSMVTTVHTLFLLARTTDTPLKQHVLATIAKH